MAKTDIVLTFTNATEQLFLDSLYLGSMFYPIDGKSTLVVCIHDRKTKENTYIEREKLSKVKLYRNGKLYYQNDITAMRGKPGKFV